MTNDDADLDRPSKSAKKREIASLQGLAEQMTGMSDQELARLDVDPRLREALALVRPMRPSGARNRQLKHCVKYMDAGELAAVRAYLDNRRSGKVAANQAFRQIEHWRDRLIAEGDPALQRLLEQQPDLDRQHLRQLCRDAVREKDNGQPIGAARKLFRYLRDAMASTNQKN
jgi:ribosome-associated protein